MFGYSTVHLSVTIFVVLGLPVLIVILWAIVKSFAPAATESQVSTYFLRK
jgi:hypothetical protein